MVDRQALQVPTSFNGKFRTLEHARAVISPCRRDYNEARPHSGIGRIPPAEFAARFRSGSINATELRIV